MKRTLERRVQTLEERVPVKRRGGPMILLPDEVTEPLVPWYDPAGNPHEPVLIVEDDRPCEPPPSSAADDSYDYGDGYDDGDDEEPR